MTFTTWYLIDCKPSSDLDWDLVANKTYFLDFGFESANFLDEGEFNARFFAATEFARRMPNAKEVVLAEINQSISVEFAEIFSEYLQRLSSALAEETRPVILCSIEESEPLEDWVLPLCKRRFEHLHLRFSKKKIPISGSESTVVVLPQDEKYDAKLFGLIFEHLGDASFKCIPEELLNEHWDEVNYIVVDKNSLGEMGRRMLLGFEAAGGETLYLNEKGQVDHPALLSE